MKHKGISRLKNRIASILYALCLALCFFGVMFQSKLLIASIIPTSIIATLLLITTNRCPNCNEYFRGAYWSKSAGFCRKCGEKLYFDDEIDNHGETSATTCYQEFGSNRVEDIQKLRSILGKRFYAVPYIGEEDGEEYYNMVLESPR